MTDPKGTVCIVPSDSDDEPAAKIPRKDEKPAESTIELPVPVPDQADPMGDSIGVGLPARKAEAAVDAVQEEEEQGVLDRECPVLAEHSYAAARDDAEGGPRMDDREGEVEQPLQPAPAFSAQLLQQSIAAMKALQLPSLARPARKTVITTRTVVVPKLAETCDPINILEPCRPCNTDSISLDAAIARIRPHFLQTEHDGDFIFYCLRRAMIGESGKSSLHCAVCRGGIAKANVLAHFLAPEHIEKVRACGGAVSLPAVQQWLHELQQAKAARAARAAE